MSETPAVPPPSSDAAAPGRSPLELGAFVTLGALAFAAVVGVIAVIDTDSRPAGFGVGIGIAMLIFFAGATIAVALACLARGRMELLALNAIVAASASIDLIVLAAWLEIDNEIYGKTAVIAFVWSTFTLVVLGLVLAVTAPQGLARALYAGAVAAAVLGATISTVLVITTTDDEVVASAGPSLTEAVSVGNDSLLRVLGVVLVLLAALWFAALAASRLPDQRLKRTLTTSPSSTT